MKVILIFAVILYTSIQVLAQKDTATLFVLGQKRTLFSKHLNEDRKLNIYLPEGYKEKDSLKYPVIYLLDGSADEDFIHICGIVQFLNYPWIGTLEKSIVVGIENVNRQRDFTFPATHFDKDKPKLPVSGGSANFIAFIEHELQKYMAENYKVNETKTIIGQSLGGLLVSEILTKKPKLFNNYIIISPSLWWDKESLLKQMNALEKKNFNPDTKIYLAVGNEEKFMVKDAEAMNKILKGKGLKPIYSYFPKENHATILHNAVYDAFLKLKDVKK